jgi:hypothetical protein
MPFGDDSRLTRYWPQFAGQQSGAKTDLGKAGEEEPAGLSDIAHSIPRWLSGSGTLGRRGIGPGDLQ